MSITAEEKKKYFAETALALSRAGFHVEEIPDNKLGVWLDEQLIEIYRCCADTLDAGFDLTYEQEKCIKSVQEQIKDGMPDIMERIREQDQHTVEPYTQEQTM